MQELINYQSAQKDCLAHLSKYTNNLSTYITSSDLDYFIFLVDNKKFYIRVLWWIEFELAGKPDWILLNLLEGQSIKIA